LWGAAAAGAGIAWGSKALLPPLHPVLTAIFVLGPFGLVYFGATIVAGFPEATRLFKRARAS
jgi:hypothetical protein